MYYNIGDLMRLAGRRRLYPTSFQDSYWFWTELYIYDQKNFEKTFYHADFQASLDKSLEHIANPVFLISKEVLTEEIKKENRASPA
jgi:hypothetical protein